MASSTSIRDIAEGLWVWRVAHPAWRPGFDWEPLVASTLVESGGETLALDPLAPPADAGEVWERLDARPPTAVVILKPDHVRDVDPFVRLYGARAFAPSSSGATTSRRRSWSRSSRAVSFPAGSSLCTTDEERALPALRALLELPFEHVIVSRGEPAHGRAAYECALEVPPWGA